MCRYFLYWTATTNPCVGTFYTGLLLPIHVSVLVSVIDIAFIDINDGVHSSSGDCISNSSMLDGSIIDTIYRLKWEYIYIWGEL